MKKKKKVVSLSVCPLVLLMTPDYSEEKKFVACSVSLFLILFLFALFFWGFFFGLVWGFLLLLFPESRGNP